MNLVVVGMGYVGLIAACCLANSGHHVVAVEKERAKLAVLRQGKVPFYEEKLDEILQSALKKGAITFTSSLTTALHGATTAILAVGTPSLADGRVDLSQVYAVMEEIIQNARDELIVIMKSTVPPGAGQTLSMRFLARCKVPVYYVSNPEFLREGKAVWDWYKPDRIVIGCDDQAIAQRVLELYADVDAPKVIMDVTSAEMVKYASNAFLATKISFINEIANLSELVGADIDSVASAVGMDQRIGPHFLQSGLGYGGSCFPKDTNGLDYISSFSGYRFSLLKAVIEVNVRQRIIAVRKLQEKLGRLYGRKIAVLGLAFKPGTDDIRESPALDIIKFLVDEGAIVSASDPRAVENSSPFLPGCVRLSSCPYETLTGVEAVLLATEWPLFVDLDWQKIKTLMREPFLVVDGRNALDADRLVELGYLYCGFGRTKRFTIRRG